MESEKKLWLNVSYLEEEDIEELLETLTFYAGDTQVWFVKDGKESCVPAGKTIRLDG